MGEELLSLKWNNHQAHFVDILTFLREQEIFIDATLACGGKLYPAHKFVLSTCSEYFKQMFTKNPSKHPIVFLKDVTCKDLEALLDFMYNGEVNVPQSSLGSLIKTAEGLQIKGLAVPDDPPTANKRDQRLAKENRELTLKRDRSFSPPASKRLRETRRSPLRNSSASILSNSSTSDKHKFSCSSSNLINVSTGLSNLETLVDENSRTSAHSGLSEASQPVNAKPNTNNHDDSASLSDNVNEPSPGPSGMHKSLQSKEEEEMEIKQEDMGLVELGEEDDWRDGEDNLDDRSRDSSLPSVNVSNYADGLIPPSENSGDRAMTEQVITGHFGVNFNEEEFFHRSNVMSRAHDTNIVNASYRLTDATTTVRSNTFNCSYCYRTFNRKEHKQKHERVHTGEKPYECSACGRHFSNKSNMKNHYFRLHVKKR